MVFDFLNFLTELPWILVAFCVVAVLVLLIISMHLHVRVFMLEHRLSMLWKRFGQLSNEHDVIAAQQIEGTRIRKPSKSTPRKP